MEIYLYGDIGFYGINSSTFSDQVHGQKDVTVHINSMGGEVFEGFAIANQLKRIPATTAVIEGSCMSIATIIALACKKVKMYKNGLFKIHNPYTFTEGDAEELRKRAEELDKLANQIAGVYVNKTGKTHEEVIELMKNSSSFNAEEALANGFIDEIIEDVKVVNRINFDKMNRNELDTLAESLMNKIAAFFKSAPKNLVTESLADGTLVEIEAEVGEDFVGKAVFVKTPDGVRTPAPDGTHTLADGTVIVTVGGFITEVTKAESELDGMKKKLAEAESKYTELKAQFDSLTNQANESTKLLVEAKTTIENYSKMVVGEVNVEKPTLPANQENTSKKKSKEEVLNALKENAKNLNK
jgi:ATP-dependent protease ClpP protease subunit